MQFGCPVSFVAVVAAKDATFGVRSFAKNRTCAVRMVEFLCFLHHILFNSYIFRLSIPKLNGADCVDARNGALLVLPVRLIHGPHYNGVHPNFRITTSHT